MMTTDTYYRGYRLSQHQVDGEVTLTHIYKDADHIDSVTGGFHSARAQVDEWMVAP